jgi:predicted nucleic acid-binding protein
VGLTVLDASVVIATLDDQDAHHAAARGALGAAWDARETIVVPAVAYAETMVRPMAAGGAVLSRADAFFRTQTIEPLSSAAARHAARLRAETSWLRLPDALIVGTALALGAQTILTADERWTGIDVPPTIRLIGGD